MANKIHWIAVGNVGPTHIKTGCGKEGWKETCPDEYTDGDYIFDAVRERSRVTCRVCLKATKPQRLPGVPE